MAPTRLNCPRCGRPLLLKTEPAPGKLVYCAGEGGHTFPYMPLPQASYTAAPPRAIPSPPIQHPPEPMEAPRSSLALPAAIAAGVAMVVLCVLAVFGLRAMTSRPAAPKDDRYTEVKPEPKPNPADPSPRPMIDHEPDVPPPPPPPPPAIPPEKQEKVNEAIRKGVEFLKGGQLPEGYWERGHPVAHAALPALTLLECGVPNNDERVQKAAGVVRKAIDDGSAGLHTYTASLMLLFLDRLGDPADAKLIRTLALRLVAGQNADGGWTYSIPKLTEDIENKLLIALDKTRPSGLDKIVMRPGGGTGPGKITIGGPSSGGPGGIIVSAPAREEEARKAIEALPEALRDLPAFRDELAAPPGRPAAKGKGGRKPRVGTTIIARRNFNSDNSNTQFGALAMWAALRHGVPMERALQRLGERFRTSQHANGGWSYQSHGGWASEAMTGVGLLGLAISKGLSGEKRSAEKDEAIEKGLKVLGGHIKPTGPINLYYWWTVERVAMLYGVKEIAGKNWYADAVELLLAKQQGNGMWAMGGYHGSNKTLDTCFALLILKRVNLAPELTRTLDGLLITGK